MDQKIILSRKGFDSSAGGVASPIFPSGELCSLPIPEGMPTRRSKRYQEITRGDQSLGTLVYDLTQRRITPRMFAHLDPDLDPGSIPRQPGWKPMFGQAGVAERHLQNQGIQAGDLFVFYGWFRQVERPGGVYRYVPGTPDLHVIFGWLQVEQRVAVADRWALPDWALDHPHCKERPYHALDSLYLSTSTLSFPGVPAGVPGAGIFQRFHPALCLTAPGMSRSVWRLPGWLQPGEGRSGLSYHGDRSRWCIDGERVLLSTARRGQEFVLDCREYPESVGWLANLFCSAYRAE